MPLAKVLVANRGEIACRIIASCRALGMRTVAVHSAADAKAMHVALADEAVGIGGPAPAGVGYPLLVKAANGGGIGMRRVDEPDALQEDVQRAQSIAERAFGDGTVYFERFVPEARHVEVQVFGLGDGTALHMYERDCSVQRRYQKVIEESPAPGISAATLRSMYDCAYDPMIAKIIVHAADRTQATALMQSTLGKVEIEGVETNLRFLRRMLANEAFRSGRLRTDLIDRHGRELLRDAA